MSRNLSPAVSRELTNLGKDTDTRKSAMNALKTYVKDLDSKAIPLFVARVSETNDEGQTSSGEYTIPLYEDLARVHGPNIVSQIDIIMGTIIRILTTSGGSFPLQQACSKVAPTIARYAIVPTTQEDEKKRIIHMLSKPLSDSLLSSHECLSSGAALCLNALVECDNWRFASAEVVNEVCLKITGALKDKTTQTASHMALVMSLAKHNSLVVEAYAGLLICSGIEILNVGTTEKRLEAIQMIIFLMRCLDIRSIYMELDLIIEEMEKFQSDEISVVRGASNEALQIARKLITGKGPKLDPDAVSVTGSNGRYKLVSGDQSSSSCSSDSQSIDSLVDNCVIADSPFSLTQASCNRKNGSWQNGGVDISLKDGIFSEIARGGASHALSECCYSSGFGGFYPSSEGFRSQTPSPQRRRPRMSGGSGEMYVTPRQIVQFCEDEEHENVESRARTLTSPCSVKCKHNSNSKAVHVNGQYMSTKDGANEQRLNQSTEELVVRKNTAALNVICSILLLLFAILVALYLAGNKQQALHLVPT